MRPAAVLIAIIFGSAAAISFGLVATVIVLFALKGRYPEYGSELAPLMKGSGWFLLLLASSGASLYGLLKARPWRGWAIGSMCLIMLVAGAYFWPRV